MPSMLVFRCRPWMSTTGTHRALNLRKVKACNGCGAEAETLGLRPWCRRALLCVTGACHAKQAGTQAQP